MALSGFLKPSACSGTCATRSVRPKCLVQQVCSGPGGNFELQKSHLIICESVSRAGSFHGTWVSVGYVMKLLSHKHHLLCVLQGEAEQSDQWAASSDRQCLVQVATKVDPAVPGSPILVTQVQG